jgi:polysaccharide biosynthesis protein PslA
VPSVRNQESAMDGMGVRPNSSALRIRAVLTLMALDVAVIFLTFAAAAWSRGILLTEAGWLLFTAVLSLMYLVVASNIHAFAAVNLQDPIRAVQQANKALVTSVAALVLLAFYTRSTAAFPRFTIALGTLGTLVAITVMRFWVLRNLAWVVGGNPFSVILISDGDLPRPPGDYSFVLQAGDEFDPDRHDPMMYDRLAATLATADRVVVSCPPERRAAWSRALQGANIQGEIAMPEL